MLVSPPKIAAPLPVGYFSFEKGPGCDWYQKGYSRDESVEPIDGVESSC